MQHILTVTDTFQIANRGVIVAPFVAIGFFEGKKLPVLVELRLPDGSRTSVASLFTIPRRSPSRPELEFTCMLPNLEKPACPIGTEIWAEIEVAD